jgi:hypothetical protein
MRVYFALLFGGRDVAEVAADTLRAEGYGVEFQPQPRNNSVAVTATATSELSAVEIAAARSRMAALASELGGDFLGHGGSEQRVLPLSDDDVAR